MKTVFRLTIASLALAITAIAMFPARAFADTTPQQMHISCTAPNPAHQTGLHRPKGDGNVWTFSIVLDGDAHFVKGPFWSYPGKDGNDPDWGLVTGGADGDSSIGWSSPGETGSFQVRVSGQIGCGNGPGGHPIDFSAGWDGSVDFNADIKVKRSGTPDSDYASSATVAAGGLSSSEHKADVQVTATDSDGNPMSGISIPAPTIQNGDGVNANASISPSSATSDSNGKADFTFTSSDIVGNVTLEEDGGESSASASVDEQWASGNGSFPTGDGNDTSFTYGMPSHILFTMALGDSSSTPITGHSIQFVTTEISGYDWDAGEEVDYSVANGGIPQEYLNLINYSAITESPPGSYAGTMTLSDSDDLSITSVTTEAVDSSAYHQ